MGGMGSSTTSGTITPDRKTHVIFDIGDYTAVQSAWGLSKNGNKLAQGPFASMSNVYFSVDGLKLAPKSGFFHPGESLVADAHILTTADMDIPTGWVSVNHSKVKTERVNAYTGATVDLPSTGNPYFTKKVPAGVAWNDARFQWSIDQTAFTSPDTDSDVIPMLRVMKGKTNHAFDQTFSVDIWINKGAQDAHTTYATAYFSGPAGFDNFNHGYGQYAVKIKGGGRMELWERGKTLTSLYVDDGWTIRDSWRSEVAFNVDHPIGTKIRLYVTPIPYTHPGFAFGSIHLYLTEIEQSKGLTSSYFENVADIVANAGQNSKATKIYRVPDDGELIPSGRPSYWPTHQQPLRLDMRQDVLGAFQVQTTPYETSGYIIDDPFQIPGLPSDQQNIVLEWYHNLPTGSAIEAKMYEAVTNTEIAPVSISSFAGNVGVRTTYALSPTNYQTMFYFKFLLTGNGTVGPTIKEVRYYRDCLIATNTPTEVEKGNIRSISISGSDSDPSHDTAAIVIADPKSELSLLSTRTKMPMRIETEYDPLDSSKRCILHRGYVYHANRTQKRSDPTKSYPTPGWGSYEVLTLGPWVRLSECHPVMFFPYTDPTQTQNVFSKLVKYKVTDVIRSILAWAGYGELSVNIPDNDIRFFPTSDEEQTVIDHGTLDLTQFAARIALEYLGSYLYFDANQGTYGKWILISPPKGPYTNLLYFTTAGPGAGKVQNRLDSYLPLNVAASGTDPQRLVSVAQQIPIFSLYDYVEPPEFNHLVLTGSAGYGAAQYRVELMNHKSYNFNTATPTADPTHIDYLGREILQHVNMPMLQGEDACKFVASRIFEIGAHGFKMFRIDAPLALMTHEVDPAKKRPPRYGDPALVYVSGVLKQCIVRSCNPHYTKDAHQMATYELQQVFF